MRKGGGEGVLDTGHSMYKGREPRKGLAYSGYFELCLFNSKSN